MKKLFLLIVVILFCVLITSAAAFAQESVPSPTPTNWFLRWEHNGVNVVSFSLSIDSGIRLDIGLPTREADGGYLHPFPELTPGIHLLEIWADNIAGSSINPAAASFSLIVIPTDAINLGIVVQ